MSLHRIGIVSATAALLAGFSFGGGYTTVSISTPSGHETEAWLYEARGDAKQDVTIVFLHGKRGNPEVNHNSRFIADIRKAGYKVIAPLMPWSEKNGYAGTREQGLEVIDAAIAASGSEKVVVVGHSMGGVAVLQYGSTDKHPKVTGLVSVAFGHDPHHARKFREYTQDGAKQACRLMDTGQGKQIDRYPEMNTGKRYKINATAEYYCTYYDLDRYPDSHKIATKIDTPLYIMSGESDRLTKVYGHAAVYDALPSNPKHRHDVLPGKHKNVLFKHADRIDAWIQSL